MKGLPPLADEAGMREAAEGRLARLLDPLRRLHPDVVVRAEVVAGPPRDVLLEASATARVLVVGT